MNVADAIAGLCDNPEANPGRGRYADELFREAIKITMEPNNRYHPPEEIRGNMRGLTGKELGAVFRLFPPEC